jgi:hypothetical protein
MMTSFQAGTVRGRTDADEAVGPEPVRTDDVDRIGPVDRDTTLEAT